MGSSSSISTKRVKLSGSKESRSNPSPAVQDARPVAKAKQRKQSTEPQAATESDPSDDDDAVEAEGPEEADEASESQVPSFKQLGLDDSLCEACANLGYKQPTPIQVRAIPPLLAGSDLIGIAETGSGKSAAFALPTINALLAKPQPLFGLVLAPTRELAAQIGQTFEALGALINLRCAVIVGGLDMVQQAIALGRKPHIVVATPGRLVDHLEKTKGFSLRTLKVLVMDEADRLLDMDFGPAIEKLLKFVPRERHTMLFSATMSNKVESLQRASLRDPIRIAIRSDSKYQTVATLKQYYVFIPEVKKDLYLIYIANEFSGKTVMIFTRTVLECQRVSLLLRCLGFGAIPLHGQLSQASRLGALNKFKTRARDILVATDVAARGLDIPSVDLVLNYDLADSSKTHVHRIGRTARAGRSGIAINFATQYVLEIYQRIEAAMGQKLPEYPTEKEEVEAFRARVEEAQRHARNEMKALDESKRRRGGGIGGAKGKGKRSRDDMDAEEG